MVSSGFTMSLSVYMGLPLEIRSSNSICFIIYLVSRFANLMIMIEITKDDIKKEAARLMGVQPERVSVEFRTLELDLLEVYSPRPLYDIFPQRDGVLYYSVCGGVVSEISESESEYKGEIFCDAHNILPSGEPLSFVPFSRLFSFPRFFESLALKLNDGDYEAGEPAWLSCSYFLCRII